MSGKYTICSKCQGAVVIQPDVVGNNNVWLYCVNCQLSFPIYANPHINIMEVEGFVPPPGFSKDNPLCLCRHTLKWHQHRANGHCIGCECIEFQLSLAA